MKVYSTKKYIIFIIIGFVVVGLIFGLFKQFFKKEKSLGVVSAEQQLVFIYPTISQYNYSNFISLIEKCRIIANEFNTKYDAFVRDQRCKKIVEELLQKIKREEQSFKSYLARMRNLNARRISSKNKKSLRYYTTIIEDRIEDLEDILEKFVMY